MTLTREQRRKIIIMIKKDLALLEDKRYSYEIAMHHHKTQEKNSQNEDNPYSKRIVEDYMKLIEIHDLDIALLEGIQAELENEDREEEEKQQKASY